MCQYLTAIGRRTLVVNFDPANDTPDLPYPCVYNVIDEFVSLEGVIKENNLGPNGGLLFCMEYMEREIESIERKIAENIRNYKFEGESSSSKNNEGESSSSKNNVDDNSDVYILFDFPGQIELFTHDTCVQKIMGHLQKLDYRLAAVQLIDSHFCSDSAVR